MKEASSDRFPGRLILDKPRPGALNMAADYYLSEWGRARRQPVLRLYTWSEPTLSLGYHQRLAERVMGRCRERMVPIVRRPTGGRAVMHDNELTYCLILPEEHPIFVGHRSELLKTIGAVLTDAGRKAGLDAALARSGQSSSPSKALRKGSPLCFDAVSRWEVQVEGRKWIGSAQRFFPGVLLQHGSIVVGPGQVDLPGLFDLKSRPTEVVDITGNTSIDRLAVAVAETFSAQWNIDWEDKPLEMAELAQIECESHQYSVLEIKRHE